MILVTGATGNVGYPTLCELIEKEARVRVLVRDKSKLGDLAGKVEVIVGDFTSDDALKAAMRGVDGMYLHAFGNLNNETANAMKVARDSGISHITLLSSLSASMPAAPDAQPFLDNEELVKNSGSNWTILRPGFFMSNALKWAPSIKNEGLVRWLPGKLASIDTRDIGAIAAITLVEPGHGRKTYDLTGPELMDSRRQVEIISEVLGSPITFEEMSVQDVVEELREAGAPEEKIKFAEGVANELAGGKWEVITDTVQELTGKKPRTFRQWCVDNIHAFK